MTLLAPPSVRALALPVLALAISGAAFGQDPAPTTPTPAPDAP